ncbi:MAG: ribokinase [Thermomicrobiales bacterium]
MPGPRDGAARLLVAGAINTDLVARVNAAPSAGETVTGQSFAQFGGGKGANQAVAAARYGADVAMLGAVGPDEFGRSRLSALAKEGIDTASVPIIAEASSGVALIVVEERTGQNRIAYIPGATRLVPAAEAKALMHRFQPLVVLTTQELPLPTLTMLLSEARLSGAKVVLNATPEAASGRSLLMLVDLLIVNETEATELLGRSVDATNAAAAVVALRSLGPNAAIITLGAAGAAVADGEEVVLIAAPAVDVVDTTGSGDAFCGVTAAGLAEGNSLVEAARSGVVAGSIAATRQGAQPSMPSRQEIDQFRREFC